MCQTSQKGLDSESKKGVLLSNVGCIFRCVTGKVAPGSRPSGKQRKDAGTNEFSLSGVAVMNEPFKGKHVKERFRILVILKLQNVLKKKREFLLSCFEEK